jgi:hypothetical protein
MANRKLSLKDAADSKLVKTLTHEDNRKAVIGGAVALGLVAAGIAALFLTPQGKQARAQVAATASKGYQSGKQIAENTLNKATDRLSTVPALANLIPVKHNGHTQAQTAAGY